MPLAVGVDVGTTNLKVVLIDDAGRTLAAVTRPLPVERSAAVAEQDADVLWATLVGRGARGPHAAQPVDVLGVCSQYSSIVAGRRARAPGRADAHVAGPARHRPVARRSWPRRARCLHDVRRAPRHPARRRRAVAGAHPLPPIRPSRTCTRAPRRTSKRWTTSPRALTGRITASQHTHVHVPAVRQPDSRPRAATTTSSSGSPASTATRLPPLVARRRARSAR